MDKVVEIFFPGGCCSCGTHSSSSLLTQPRCFQSAAPALLTSAAGKPSTPSSHRPSLRVEASSALTPPLDALSWLLSLSLVFSPCRPAHHRAESLCAAPPAKSDAPTANSLELEPREALRRIVEASPTNFRANPLPSRSDLASSSRLPRRRRPPSAPHH